MTLAGEIAVHRAGVSLLNNIGLGKLVTRTPVEYVKMARALAGNLPALATVRAGLRERMRKSPLCDAKGFANNVEHAYRTIWQRWCETTAAL